MYIQIIDIKKNHNERVSLFFFSMVSNEFIPFETYLWKELLL